MKNKVGNMGFNYSETVGFSTANLCKKRRLK